MILAFDTYYYQNQARTVAVAFSQWPDEEPLKIYAETTQNPAEYEPGSFYKRELPCILSLIRQIDLSTVSHIIVDGYAVLDDAGKPGLGGHLYDALGKTIPIIGVAKSDFRSLKKGKVAVLRGQSQNPLFVTASGMEVETAAAFIDKMHGQFRIPTLLGLLDRATKDGLK